MDKTMNLAMTFQMTLDCFLKEKQQNKYYSAHQQQALLMLEKMTNYRSFEKKVIIAKQVLARYPDCIEAYFAYGYYTKDCFKKMQILKEGMEKATLLLGKEFFLQECEDFYQFEQAHPYFEIKYAYALTLFENGYMRKAKQQLKEMINLHPKDHYRAHELLYVVYLYFEEEQALKEVMHKYQDRNTLYVYVLFLLAMKQNRFEQAKEMIPILKESNAYLFAIICHQRLHLSNISSEFEKGSEEEAAYVYQLLSKLWMMQQNISLFLNDNENNASIIFKDK